MRKLLLMIMLPLSLSLSGCHSLFSQIHIYDIQQGNVVTPEMLSRLHVGMGKEQVRNLLGDPIMNNNFSLTRWDYVYTMQKNMHARQEKLVTVFFNNAGTVVSIQRYP